MIEIYVNLGEKKFLVKFYMIISWYVFKLGYVNKCFSINWYFYIFLIFVGIEWFWVKVDMNMEVKKKKIFSDEFEVIYIYF